MLTYLDLFTGIGGFTNAIENANLRPIQSSVPKRPKELHDTSDELQQWECVAFSEIDKHATAIYKFHYPSHKNYGDITQIDPATLPDFDLLTGGFPCFVEGTLVLTKRGLIPIEDIRIGDKVCTHKRRWRRVTEKHISHSRQTRKIKCQGCIEIATTDEHPFYARERGRIWDNKKRTYKRVFKKAGWTKASELSAHYIGQTIPKTDYNYESEDFWWLVGRYIADGWLVNRRDRGNGETCKVVFGIGKAKSEEFERKFPSSFYFTKTEERTVFKYHVSNKQFAEFLKPCGRMAHNKEIRGKWFGLSKKNREALINGYLSGDGSIDKNGRRATTTSKKLALGIAMLGGASFGVRPTIVYTKRPKTTIIEGRTVNQRDTWTVQFPNRNKSGFVDEWGSWGLVRKNEPTKRKETVYNIAVEEDNSYTANGAVVHNCQSFSVAGKRRGFSDTRGTLFFDVARILRYKKPKYFLLENVKGLLSHDGGSTFSTIIETLQKIGYGVSWEVLNTKDFGIPQNRERVFIFGVRGECPREILPLRESNEKGDERNKRKIRVINQQTRSKDRPSLKYSSGGSGTLCKNDEAFCLPAGGGGGQYIQKENNRRIRRLTPRECERLQGFEDSWTKFGNYDGKIKEVSDTQRYKVLGNAITVKVAEAVIRQMCQ